MRFMKIYLWSFYNPTSAIKLNPIIIIACLLFSKHEKTRFLNDGSARIIIQANTSKETHFISFLFIKGARTFCWDVLRSINFSRRFVKMRTTTVVKFLFSYFSAMGCFSVELKWDDKDAYIFPIKGPKLCVWYLSQFITFIQVPIFSYGLYSKWEVYVNHNLYFRLVFHCLWIVLCTLCCTFQWIFFKRQNEVLSLVNQTVLLKTYLENRKLKAHYWDMG